MKQDSSSGYEALRGAAALVDRGSSARLLLTGADRRAYLQGLLTNDIEALVPGTGCYAAMLTAQGRMMTDVRVLELGDGVLLDVPAGVAPQILEHLDRFVFSEDVQVRDVTAEQRELGVYGPQALAVLQRAGTEGAAPSAPYSVNRVRIAGADALLVRSDDAGQGYDVVAPATAIAAIEQALLAAGAVRATAADLDVVRIENGRPAFGIDMDTDTIPLEAGIEDRAISRSKGCYVGQEVIVRVIDRGHGRVARRLVGFTLSAQSPVPAAGARVIADGRDVGRITSAAFSPALARPIALGYVHRDAAEPGTAVTVDGSGDAIVARLPFVPGE